MLSIWWIYISQIESVTKILQSFDTIFGRSAKSFRKFDDSLTERYLEELEDVLTISSSVEVD